MDSCSKSEEAASSTIRAIPRPSAASAASSDSASCRSSRSEPHFPFDKRLAFRRGQISDCGSTGIYVFTSGGTAAANINHTRISRTDTGIEARNGSRVTITKSTIYFNKNGVFQAGAAGGSTVTAVGSTFGYSSIAALQATNSRPQFYPCLRQQLRQ